MAKRIRLLGEFSVLRIGVAPGTSRFRRDATLDDLL